MSEQQHSFARRLREKHGAGVDPEISLDGGESERRDRPSTELLRRLAAQAFPRTRYELKGEIARGGMGAILEVWDEDLRRSLAMKVILGQDGEEAGEPAVDGRLLARFLEEAQVTGQLDHPGVVPVHELGIDAEGRVYFTMKLVKGRDLKTIFDLVFDELEGWSETRALGVVQRVCEAMAYAHAKGVIHRDLKPANVMVGGFGEVFVMDWGLARVLGREDSHDLRLASAEKPTALRTARQEERQEAAPGSPLFTMDGDIVGTPAYMPPEQARGELGRITPRSDVYAIGTILYHLLGQRMPYVEPGELVSGRTILARLLEGPPKPLRSLRADLPAELEAICEKAMAREPDRRYPDTLTLAEDLRAYLENRVVRAYETGAVAELRKWIARNRGLAASLGAAVLLLVAGLAVSLAFKARSDRNATLAHENEKRALEGESLAQAEKTRAEENERLATRRADDVLRLSASRKLASLIAEADSLWPAHPDSLQRYDDWLVRARDLVAGLEPSADGTDIGHRARLAERRARALPSSDAEREATRQADPRLAEFQALQEKLAALERAHSVREGREVSEPPLDEGALPPAPRG